MIASFDFAVRWNGADYRFKKGEKVDVPDALLGHLKAQGLVEKPTTRKKGSKND
jgi:hypothetical protein